jgi:hypothetical protein
MFGTGQYTSFIPSVNPTPNVFSFGSSTTPSQGSFGQTPYPSPSNSTPAFGFGQIKSPDEQNRNK